jgi:hypothetical protein
MGAFKTLQKLEQASSSIDDWKTVIQIIDCKKIIDEEYSKLIKAYNTIQLKYNALGENIDNKVFLNTLDSAKKEKELKELYDIEVEIPNIELSKETLKNIKKEVRLTIADISMLYNIFTIQEEEK